MREQVAAGRERQERRRETGGFEMGERKLLYNTTGPHNCM
jgi:hypothetical protein